MGLQPCAADADFDFERDSEVEGVHHGVADNGADLALLLRGHVQQKFVVYLEHQLRAEAGGAEGAVDAHHRDFDEESREKLKKSKPETLAQASRIPGVNPSDVAIMAIIIKRGSY